MFTASESGFQPPGLERIHAASMWILEKVGVRFDHQETLELFRHHGFAVDGQVVRFSEDRLRELLALAPASFTLAGRDPGCRPVIGDPHTHPAPIYGASLVCLPDGRTRDADLEDYRRLIRLHQVSPHFALNGGLVVQPAGVGPQELLYETLKLTDKALIVPGDGLAMARMMDMLAVAFGGRQALLDQPRAITIINPNSPLSYDPNQLEALWRLVERGQVPVITPGAMPGATGPIFNAGILAQINAETLAGVALCQLIRHGAPVIYGTSLPVMDLRNGYATIGNPEFGRNCLYGKALAARYGLPARGGGAGCDAHTIGAQAGYESMLNLMATFQSGMNLSFHCAGVMHGLRAVSYEKIVQDCELLEMVKTYHTPVDLTHLDASLEAIGRLGPGGNHLMEQATVRHCRTEYFLSGLALHGRVDAEPEAVFAQRLGRKLQTMLDSYQEPTLPPDLDRDLRRFLEHPGRDAA